MRFLTSGDLDFGPFQLKIGTPLTRALENVHTNFAKRPEGITPKILLVDRNAFGPKICSYYIQFIVSVKPKLKAVFFKRSVYSFLGYLLNYIIDIAGGAVEAREHDPRKFSWVGHKEYRRELISL